jgi:soluble lytic murein transglycosylase-like protein
MIYLLGVALVAIIFTGSEIAKLQDKPSYDDLFKKYASRYGLDWKMLKAIAIIESRLGDERSVKNGISNPKDIENSKSYDGLSWGLMQVTISTASDYDPSVTAEKLNNPEYSVKIASQYLADLKKLFSQYDRVSEYMVKSYNQGQGNTLKEIAMKGGHFADAYFLKYLNAYSNLEGI